MTRNQRRLSPQLNSWQLWGIAVGMVISGQYFGWNDGLPHCSLAGLLLSLLVVTVFYAGFMRLYLQLALAMPRAGGVMWYLHQTVGKKAACLGGYAAMTEYFFAVAAISLATGAYCHGLWHTIPMMTAALTLLTGLTLINLAGVVLSAKVELLATLLALLGLVIVIVACGLPHPSAILPTHILTLWPSVMTALPFILWLYLGIEGITLTIEEARDPAHQFPRAVTRAMLTLILTAVCIVWQIRATLPNALLAVNNPLPMAMAQRFPMQTGWTILISLLGLCGLLASLNGLLLAASRQLLALAGAGFAPTIFRRLSRHAVPAISLIAIAVCSLLAIITLSETLLLRLAILGALSVYAGGLMAWFCWQRQHTNIRHQRLSYAFAMVISLLCFLCIVLVLHSL